MKKDTKHLTEGNIAKSLVLFALPILAGQLFQTLYNSVDALVVGRNIGKTALAAVTSSSDISQLIVGFFTGLSSGSGILFSRCYGARDYEKLHDSLHTTELFSIILGVTMTIVAIIISPFLLHAVGCPSDVYQEALSYLRVYFIGIQFTALYNVGAGILRSCGDSKNPFNYLVISSAANIILDVLFVVVFKTGVYGVALATIISQLLSVVLVFEKLIKTKDVSLKNVSLSYKLNVKELRIDKGLLFEVISLAIPSAVQTCLVNFSNMFVQSWVNSFGSSAMAGTGAAKKTERYLNAIASSMSNSVCTFVAQNTGAKKYGRVKKGIVTCFAITFAITIGLGSIIYLRREFFVRLFIDDIEAVKIGMEMLSILVPLYCLQATYHIMTYVIKGFGKSLQAMIITISGLIVLRHIFLNIAMAANNSISNVFYSYPVGWTSTAVLAFIYYFFVIKKEIRRKKEGVYEN